MSEIDCHAHRLLCLIECPTDFPQLVVSGRASPVFMAVYELLEDVAPWSARAGDIVLGGGAGECPAFRISMPIAEQLLLEHADPESRDRIKVCQSYWSPSQSFALCNAFLKMGWVPGLDVELWLAEYALRRIRQGDLSNGLLKDG